MRPPLERREAHMIRWSLGPRIALYACSIDGWRPGATQLRHYRTITTWSGSLKHVNKERFSSEQKLTAANHPAVACFAVKVETG